MVGERRFSAPPALDALMAASCAIRDDFRGGGGIEELGQRRVKEGQLIRDEGDGVRARGREGDGAASAGGLGVEAWEER